MRKKTPVLRQAQTSECGLFCVAMVAGYHGRHVDLSKLREQIGASPRGATLRAVIKIADRLDLSSRAVRVPMSRLPALKLPCVLHWGLTHFVVLTDIRRGRYYINDPAFGDRVCTDAELSDQFTGIALELTPKPEFAVRDDRGRRAWLGSMLKIDGVQGMLAQVLGLALVLHLCMMIAPFMLQWSMDEVISLNNRALMPRLVIVFVSLAIFQMMITATRSWVISSMSTEVNHRWASGIFRHLIGLPLDYFETRLAADIYSRFQSLNFLQRTFTTQFIEIFVDGLLVCISLAVVVFYKPLIALVSICAALLYAGIRWLIAKRLKRHTVHQIEHSTRQYVLFHEAVRAIQSLKLYGQTSQRAAAWSSKFSDQMNAESRISVLHILQQSVGGLLGHLDRIAAIAIGALAVSSGQMTIGVLFAILAYREQFAQRVFSMIERSTDFALISIHADRVADIIESPSDPMNEGGTTIRSDDPFELELKNVFFSYSAMDPLTVKDFSMKLSDGENVVIVGPSGCGKTTILKLMLGLLKCSEGEIILNGKNLSTYDMESYRGIFGTVMQSDSLLIGTIAENIALFDQAPDIERMVQSARIADIDARICALPMGYNTMLGDSGNLSGGEKQRILLARALYRRPRVLLMDEATSHLDIEAERRVNDGLRSLGVTKVFVAHRPDSIALADRQVVLAEGDRVVGARL